MNDFKKVSQIEFEKYVNTKKLYFTQPFPPKVFYILGEITRKRMSVGEIVKRTFAYIVTGEEREYYIEP